VKPPRFAAKFILPATVQFVCRRSHRETLLNPRRSDGITCRLTQRSKMPPDPNLIVQTVLEWVVPGLVIIVRAAASPVAVEGMIHIA
jgi:hypothetical protein